MSPIDNIGITYACADEDEKNKWMKDIAEQIEKTHKDPRTTIKREDSLDPAKWKAKVSIINQHYKKKYN